MIENCHQDNIIEMNFNNMPCCLKHLLIMNKMSEEYLLSYEFGKYLLKILKNIFEKNKRIIRSNAKINDNIFKDFCLMITKNMSHLYFVNKTNLAKYLCKSVFNIYSIQEFNNYKFRINEINSIKNNLCCIYNKEKKFHKAFKIIKELYEANKSNNNNDNLIYLNNYIILYLKSKTIINKDVYNKINTMKSFINQRINQISQLPKINDNNMINSKKSYNTYSISEIQLYIFLYYNCCNFISKCNNNQTQIISYYKKGYELSMFHFGESHHLTIKFKNILNKTLFKKVNLKNVYKYNNNYENTKTTLTKSEINSKLDEINSRLEKLGNSFSPVKQLLSNYYMEEQKLSKNEDNYKLNKNNLKIKLYEKDTQENNENKFNKINFDNNILRDSINNNKNKSLYNNYSDYNIYNKSQKENKQEIDKKDIPKLVINLDNHNNDELVCTTLYQEVKEEEIINENTNNKNISIPKLIISLDNHNNDDLVCTTLYQEASENENEKKEEEKNKIPIPKLVISLDNHNNDDLVCTTLYQEASENENEKKEEEKNKIPIPKLVISLDNHNNDNLECTTLYQEMSEDEAEKANSKEKKITLPKISLCLDQTNNDDYVCETFFLPTDEEKKEENKNTDSTKIIKSYSYDSKKEESNKNVNKINFSFNIIKSEDTEQNPITESENDEKNINSTTNTNKNINAMNNEELLNKFFIDIKFYRPLEIKNNQKEEIFDIAKFINEIKDKTSDNENKCDYKIRICEDKKYLIKLDMFTNDSVKISLIDKNDNNELFSSKYSYNKIVNLYKIIRHDLCLKNMETYYHYSSYNDYISRTFLNFITINKEKGAFKFKMAKKPLGLCHCNIVVQLHFCKCAFDMIVFSKNYCRIIFSSENDDFNSMGIDTYFDDESFDMLIDSELLEDKAYVYSFKNNDLNKNELLLELIKNIQKCVNSYCSGVVNVFDDIYLKTNPNQKKLKELLIFKLNISNKLNDCKLYVCEFGNRLCKVVSVDQKLVKLKGIIYSCEINELFGYETNDIWNKLVCYQKVIFGQMILNSVFFNESNSRICINKYEVINELNFVKDLKVCNFSLIKLNQNLKYIKFTIYKSVGTCEYTKIIFVNSKNNINNLKLINIKDKLIDELNITTQSFDKGNDSLFTYLNID